MNVLDLFSGIGGFSLGLERAGFKTVAFCEIEPFCQKVLKKHWPEVPIFEDVTALNKETLHAAGITVDVICGGFPCQDISFAGKGAGLEGERSGLWREFARLIGELRPRYVIVENVAALLSRGFEQVLGDLASLGYDAEWHCIPASAIGAVHHRDRIWIIAYTNDQTQSAFSKHDEKSVLSQTSNLSNANNKRVRRRDLRASKTCKTFSNSNGAQFKRRWVSRRTLTEYSNTCSNSWWEIEPNVDRVAYGVPNWTHRLKALGNAVVPQIPELIGRAIMQQILLSEEQSSS